MSYGILRAANNNNNNEYLERLTRTGPKCLHVLYKYIFVKIQCIQHECTHTDSHMHAHTRTHTHTHKHQSHIRAMRLNKWVQKEQEYRDWQWFHVCSWSLPMPMSCFSVRSGTWTAFWRNVTATSSAWKVRLRRRACWAGSSWCYLLSLLLCSVFSFSFCTKQQHVTLLLTSF